jgi:single-stranded DNA-specific DHH superfamily exonuclease
MQKKISINKNIIIYDEESEKQDIDDILKLRLQFDELEKTIDDLFDPYLLSDMKKAVDRIKKAKELDEKVMIF